MPQYEYKAIPAPAKGEKAKGVKAPEARFAQTIEAELNRVAAQGWEYMRAELLPSQERSGLTGSVTKWRTLLIFRRARKVAAEPDSPRMASGAETMLRDNGVEELSEVAGMTTSLRARAESQGADDPQIEDPDDHTVVPLPTRDDGPKNG